MALTYTSLVDEQRGLAAKAHELRSKSDRSEAETTELRSTLEQIIDLDALVQVAERDQRDALVSLAFASAAEREANGPTRSAAPDTRSAGTLVTEDPAYVEWASAGATTRSMPAVEVRTLIDSGASPSQGDWLAVGQPITPNPRQIKFFIRDVLSVQSTGLAAVPYIRELNPLTNEAGATGVAEGSPKPEIVMETESDTATVKKIAAWVPITEEVLADAPTLSGYINTRLAYMIKVREQAALINGAGTGAQLKGILSFSGVQTLSGTTPDDLFAQVGSAIGKIENVDGDANFAACNPLDFWTAQVTRQANAFDGGRAGAGAPFDNAAGSIWGLTAIRSRALSSGKVLVGDGVMGATVFDRMSVTVRSSDSHSDYFTNNKIVLLAEERIALAVHRPDFFVDVTL
jgi:HK97 family phage major capsid protein